MTTKYVHQQHTNNYGMPVKHPDNISNIEKKSTVNDIYRSKMAVNR